MAITRGVPIGRRAGIAAACLILVGLAALVLPHPALAANTTFVDCLAPTPGDGSESNPLNSLAQANAVTLDPGDTLLLKRGTTCSGTFAPQGGGSPGTPATIGAYGSGPLPKIIGTGPGAVNLIDLSNLTVEDLDVSNPGSASPPVPGGDLRNGVTIRASAGTVENVTVRRLRIHDVGGDLTKNLQGSAGILATVTGPPPARFSGLTIEDNDLSAISRSGISIYGTNADNRPAATDPWPEASTGVLVRGNRIDRFAGDGIVPRGTDGAIVEGNVLSNGSLSGRKLGHPDGEVCNAGIWAFRANNTLIQNNEVSGMRAGCDGTGFDLDYNQDGTIIQHNFSHDNEGGFVLLCADTGRRGDVRFNLSLNDASTINHGPCAGHFGDLGGIRFFNNTIVAPAPNASMQLVIQNRIQLAGSFEFRNNLVYATTRQSAPLPCGDFCSNNLFFNLPASGSAAITANPRLVDPARTGTGRLTVGPAFRLTASSPARGAGLSMPDPGITDYFGNPLGGTGRPAIGFDQTPAAKPKPRKPSRACLKARKAERKATGRLKAARRTLKRLKRHRATRKKVRKAARKVSIRKREKAKRSRITRRTCRTRSGRWS